MCIGIHNLILQIIIYVKILKQNYNMDLQKTEFAKKIHTFVSQTYADYYIKYLKEKKIQNVKSCFDIGADLGTLVNELNKMGIDTEGIEQNYNNIINAVTSKITHGTFNIEYTTDKKYDLVTLPQVIYFLGDILELLKKIKTMLNPNGIVFIVTSSSHSKDHISKYKNHKLYSKEQYCNIASKLGFEIIDYTEVQTNIGTAFKHGKVIGLLKMAIYKIGIKKAITKKKCGNFTFLLMKSNS
jgi:2-polyprenyl-3-methyl-5-hydroxy-6-metoxy-1,4-benzoquinol methylase